MILLFYKVVVCLLAIQVVNTADSSSSPCETIVTRYYECKHLKMRVTNNESGVYEVDKSVPDNYLNALFYKSMLSNMTLERALNLQRDIYLSATTNLNTSFFSRCVSQVNTTRNYLKDSNYGFAFSNDNNEMFFSQFKQVVIDLVNRIGLRNVTEKSASHSLARFCFKYDILTRTIFDIVQNNDNWTYLESKHEQLIEDCLLPDMDRISFRYLIKQKPGISFDLKFKEDETKVAVCRVKSTRDEDFGEAFAHNDNKRFILGAIYPRGFKNLWRDERNLSSFVESMSRKVSDAEEKQIAKRNKSSLHLGISNKNSTFQLVTFDGTRKWQKICEKQRVSLFTSHVLNITADIAVNRLRFFGYNPILASVESITICSVYDPASRFRYQRLFNHTFTLSYSFVDMSHENFILDQNKETDKIWIRWLRFRKEDCVLAYHLRENLAYFDFRFNLSVSIDCETIVNIAMSEYLASQALGGMLLK